MEDLGRLVNPPAQVEPPAESSSPEHLYVEGNGGSAKLWLDGVRLERSAGYKRRQLMQIVRIVEAHADEFEARWRDYFD